MRQALLIIICSLFFSPASAQTLKDAIGQYCLIGAAVNQWQSDGQVPEADAVLDKHFNCAVAENCMKPETLAPAEGIFDFRVADKFVSYCQLPGMAFTGSRLVVYQRLCRQPSLQGGCQGTPDQAYQDCSGSL